MDTSGIIGTWYLNATWNNPPQWIHDRLTLTIEADGPGGAYRGTLINEAGGTAEPIDHITWDAGRRRLGFRRLGNRGWQWYLGTVVEGVLVGRYSHSDQPLETPPHLTAYQWHVTGWNADYLETDIVPRVYDVVADNEYLVWLRLDRDRDGHTLGRWKVYATVSSEANAEEPEYDLEVTRWDGTHLEFVRRDLDWVQRYEGMVNGRTVMGTYTHNDTGPFPWKGTRAEVLTYGLVAKRSADRALWQDRTQQQLYHLMMANNPRPLARSVQTLQANVAPHTGGPNQPWDDNADQWPQNYTLTELQFDYTLPNPYDQSKPLERRSHAYLAVPNGAIASGRRHRAVLALNGHHGSAWQMIDPPNGNWYRYGDAYARRGFVVLAVDISHRPPEDSRPLYDDDLNAGDDPGHGNGPHPAIKAPGFDSDWEEDGERVWDAMRALDYLLELPYVDTQRVLVTGLSMGGEVTTFVGALDPRLAMSIPAGFSPDLGVMLHYRDRQDCVNINHPCWRWINADIREYIDASDLHALTAPRPLIIETGKKDCTYSSLPTPFAADKQVARRSRVAYDSDHAYFVHYLHAYGHEYHVGDVTPHPDADHQPTERGVHVPSVTEPPAGAPWSTDWQQDGTTNVPRIETINSDVPTLFDYIDYFYGSLRQFL